MVQGEPAPAGDQQIGPAVAVVVTDRCPVGVEDRLAESGLLGDILELPVPQVLIEAAGIAFNHLLVRPIVVAAAGYEDVEQAIAVVVQQRHAAAERFEDGEVSCLLTIAVGESDARIGSHVAVQLGHDFAIDPTRQYLLGRRRQFVRCGGVRQRSGTAAFRHPGFVLPLTATHAGEDADQKEDRGAAQFQRMTVEKHFRERLVAHRPCARRRQVAMPGRLGVVAEFVEIVGQGPVRRRVQRIDLQGTVEPAQSFFGLPALQKDHACLVSQTGVVRR